MTVKNVVCGEPGLRMETPGPKDRTVTSGQGRRPWKQLISGMEHRGTGFY